MNHMKKMFQFIFLFFVCTPCVFADIQTDINNAPEGSTIKLEEDLSISLNIPADKKITLDLNNHSIRIESGDVIKNYGILTITGEGTLYSETGWAIYNENEIHLNGGTYETGRAPVIYNPQSDVYIDAATLKSNTGNIIYNVGGNIEIKDSTLSTGDAIAIYSEQSGNIKVSSSNIAGKTIIFVTKSSSLIINDSIIKSEKGNIVNNENSNVEVKNSTMTTGETIAYYSNAKGTNKVSSSSIIGKGTLFNVDNAELIVDGGKYETKGHVFSVLNNSTITIEDGEFISDTVGLSIDASSSTIKKATITAQRPILNYHSNLTIHDGNFTMNNDSENNEFINMSDTANTKILGGRFMSDKDLINICKGTFEITGGEFDNVPCVDAKTGYDYYITDDTFTADITGKITSENVYVELNKTKELSFIFDENTSKYSSYTKYELNNENIKIEDSIAEGKKVGESTITINLIYKKPFYANVYIYDVISKKEETNPIKDQVSNIIDNILSGKEVEGIDEELIKNIQQGVLGESIYFEPVIKNNSSIDENNELLSNILNKDEKISDYYEIEIAIKKESDDTLLGTITDFEEKIELSIDIPSNLPQEKEGYIRNYEIIELVNGKAEKLDSKVEDGKIKFNTNKASTYAITYTDVKNPNTGDSVAYSILSVMTSLFIFSALLLKKKNF